MFNTNRGILKFILLNLITLNIYGIVVFIHISDELNISAMSHDGKHMMNYAVILFIFSWLTFGIVPLIWWHQVSNRIGSELEYRNTGYYMDASDFWLWGVLGSLIIVGPFVYIHKLLKSMNILNDLYKKRHPEFFC